MKKDEFLARVGAAREEIIESMEKLGAAANKAKGQIEDFGRALSDLAWRIATNGPDTPFPAGRPVKGKR